MQTAYAINTLSEFLAVRDVPVLTQDALLRRFGFPRADVMVLFGGSVLAGGDVLASAIRENAAKTYVIVGGAGHTTPDLRKKMQPFLPHLDTADLPEAVLFDRYIHTVHQVQAHYLETKSTNCGNNITYLLRLLTENRIPCSSIILTQDGTMQRRMGATLAKEAPHIQQIHFAAYQAHVDEKGRYTADIRGMWPTDRFVTMLLGEISRLRDDENGYGPRGKNFIAHVDIPADVEAAFAHLQSLYAVRDADPLFAT